ncbi:MAG: DNA alkylation repair protein [Salibacteraceae bacterium]
MEPFKNIYNENFFKRFIAGFKKVYPSFNESSFLNDVYDSHWNERELKQRMRHISMTLDAHLTNDYASNVKLLVDSIPFLKEQGFQPNNLEFIIYPDYLEVFGLDHYATSISAMETITQFVSCEFGIRPFIIKYESEMAKQMYRWTFHESEHVRRLASEGVRPRLPWAMGIESFKKDPIIVFSILDNLKDDESEYVRRSVANNWNDISKDHPRRVIEMAKEWLGFSKERDKLVKHACRTLLKQGDKEIMSLFGFGNIDQLNVNNFRVKTPTVKVGGILEFDFEVQNTSLSDTLLRLEYGVYYQKANGSLSRKVYKISEKKYGSMSSVSVTRKQPFKIITTRKLHLGPHQVSIIINGIELEKRNFNLIA